ncbi:hypothetical protein ACIA8R_43915 [Nonomuraea sp. NPDC051191]|uniref:hypothetical protein n=1 Tax=Nonomuraea sp. NPDC051191 TaxID=3364372 RepID=UPI0037993D7A
MAYKPRLTEKTLTLKGADIAAGSFVLWRASVPCKVKAVRAYRVGGTAAAVNGTRTTINPSNGSPVTTNLLTGDLSVSSASTWMAGSLAGLANRRFLEGDTLAVTVVSAGGSPTDLIIQVDIEKDANF